jgi:hypothetical protein
VYDSLFTTTSSEKLFEERQIYVKLLKPLLEFEDEDFDSLNVE